MKKKHLCISAAAALLFLSGCSTDKETDLVGPGEPIPPNTAITYEANIRAIITNNCTSCHSNPPTGGAPFGLTTFDQVRAKADNGALLKVLGKPLGDPGVMPPSGPLPQTTIDLITKWIAEGAVEK